MLKFCGALICICFVGTNWSTKFYTLSVYICMSREYHIIILLKPINSIDGSYVEQSRALFLTRSFKNKGMSRHKSGTS